MHLLNTESMRLEFHNTPPNRYAILSHTWGDDEVLYEDIKSEDQGRSKEGFKKVENCCKLAFSEGYRLIWIDTCCIDKSSSAELSEAINSMFDWYRRSTICYTFLEDFSPTEVPVPGLVTHDWKYCRYFTRGWTLQELLASPNLHFYDRNWRYFKSKRDIADKLAPELGIAIEILRYGYRPRRNEYSIATRMSWASKRKTSRPEDMAYCLLGIFGVNMPLLYGEGGTKAFIRLQEEIMRTSNDESIFAWADPDFGTGVSEMDTNLLAKSPASFVNASKIVPFQSDSEPYFMTNMGLSICLPVLLAKFLPNRLDEERFFQIRPPEYAVLNCHYHDDFRGPLCLELRPLGINSNRFGRSHRRPFQIESSLAAKAEKRSIFISRFGSSFKDTDRFSGADNNNYNSFWVRTKISHQHFKNQPLIVQGFPLKFWNYESAVLSLPRGRQPRGAALLTIGETSDQPLQFAVIFQVSLWGYFRVDTNVVLLMHHEFDKTSYHNNEYAHHFNGKIRATSSLQLLKDVQVVATVKEENIMGKPVNVIELCVNHLEKNFTRK